MLVYWWEHLENWDMLATTSVKTYRGDTVIDRHYYRKTFGPKLVTQMYTQHFFILIKNLIW